MVTLNQKWEEIQSSLSSKRFSKVFFYLLAAALLFWGGKSFLSYINPKTQTYTIAQDPSWYPMFPHGNGNCITAFSTEMLFAIARQENLKLELTNTTRQMLFEQLDDGKVDGVLTALSPDLTLQEVYNFSEPYYHFGAVLVVPQDSNFSSLQDLENKTVAVKRGSTVLFHLPLGKSTIVTPFDSPTLILDELLRDKVDAVIMDQFTAHIYLKGLYREKLKIANLPMTLEGLRLVTRKEVSGSQLIDKFNSGLREIKKLGIYDELISKWDLYNPKTLECSAPSVISSQFN